jgi:hypothetical protein
MSMTQDLDAGGSGGTSAHGYASATMQDIANSMLQQPSVISAPYIQGGYTDLLLGVRQDAAMSSSARKLYFDENM